MIDRLSHIRNRVEEIIKRINGLNVLQKKKAESLFEEGKRLIDEGMKLATEGEVKIQIVSYPGGDFQEEPAQGVVSGDLFERLREWRKKTAQKEGKPAFAIFHDSVLKRIVSAKPRTLDALVKIEGMNRKKKLAYGEEILRIIEECP